MTKTKQNEINETTNIDNGTNNTNNNTNNADDHSCSGSCNSNSCGCSCEEGHSAKSNGEANQHEKNKFELNLENLSAEELKQIINELNLELEQKEILLEQKENSQSQLQNKLNDVILAAKQIMADFDNFRKRTDNEKQKETQLAAKSLIMKLLPVMDQFALCLQNSAHTDEFVKTVPLMYTQIMAVMEDSGLKPINALNQKFDPKMHEAIMLVPSQGEDNIVVEEVQKGYFIYDTLVRMSKVKVSKNINNMEE